MFGPVAFSFFTLLHASIALAALTAFNQLPAAAICLFVVEAVTAFDNAVTVAGNRIGIGVRAERLNRLRFLFHALCIGLLLPVYSGIANAVAFSGTAALLVNYGAWVLAGVLILYGYFKQYRGTGVIMPVSYYGCLRYAQSVSAINRHPDYSYTEEELAGKGQLPFASIATVLVGLIISFFVGWISGLWIPFAATLLMFVAGGLPMRSWGPFATSCLEVFYSSGMLYGLLFAAANL